MTASPLRVGACVVSYCGSENLDQLVAALRAGLEQVVVAATSPVAAPMADVTMPNVGYGTAANAAFNEAKRAGLDWWVVANDDLSIDPTGCDLLRSRLEMLPAEVVLWSFTGCSTGIAPRRPGRSPERSPHGAMLAVRSEVFFAIGGFDPRFFLYSEEVDLWLRLPPGTTSGYETAPYLRHEGSGTTGHRPAAHFELGRSTGMLVLTHRYLAAGTLRALAAAASLAIRRRRPTAAVSFLGGFLAGVIAPGFERVAIRTFGAAPVTERRRIGALRPDAPEPT